MPRDLPKEFWVDVLNRKHECGPYLSRPKEIEVTHGGERLRVWVPDNLPDPERFELKATVRGDGLLVLFGRHSLKDYDDSYDRGILMVARLRVHGAYVVHVWHELYPWALDYLGLTPNDLPARESGE
jgi:hypothetical protein